MDKNNINSGINFGNIGGCGNTVNISPNESIELNRLLSEIQSALDQANITVKQKEEANQYLATIENETVQSTPQKNKVRDAVDGLKKIAQNVNILDLVEKLSQIIFAMMQK